MHGGDERAAIDGGVPQADGLGGKTNPEQKPQFKRRQPKFFAEAKKRKEDDTSDKESPENQFTGREMIQRVFGDDERGTPEKRGEGEQGDAARRVVRGTHLGGNL